MSAPENPAPTSRIDLSWSSAQRFDATNASGLTLSLDGDKTDGFSPTEALLSSLGACMGIDVVLILEKMRTGLEGLRMTVRGERVAEPPRYFNRIHMRFHIQGDVARDKAERAVHLSAEKYCSVLHTLSKDIDIVTETVLE